MHSFVFKEKLKKLNPALYLDESYSRAVGEEWKVVGLFLKKAKRSVTGKGNYTSLQTAEREWLEAYDEGALAEHIGSVPSGYVPEHDKYNVETGKLQARGWRTIVLKLVEKRLCTLERARIVFSRSLGEADYDQLNSYQKRKLAGYEQVSAREQLRRKGFF